MTTETPSADVNSVPPLSWIGGDSSRELVLVLPRPGRPAADLRRDRSGRRLRPRPVGVLDRDELLGGEARAPAGRRRRRRLRPERRTMPWAAVLPQGVGADPSRRPR